MSAEPAHPALRHRPSSIQLVLQHVTASPASDHAFSATNFDQTLLASQAPPFPSKSGLASKAPAVFPSWEHASRGFWHDLRTMGWMRHPGTSFRMILVFLSLWVLFQLLLRPLSLTSNPIAPFIFISYPLPLSPGETHQRYGKGPKDLLLLAFYVIVFSFIRQTVTESLLKPFAGWIGLRGIKQQRFVEQGYAVLYWGSASVIGLWVMSKQPTWWYNTSEFWRAYPHDRMEPNLKAYYLVQFAFWLQQMLLLVLRLEKPRSDFVELVIHHCVTLWLVGVSYSTNLTMIGTAIFVSMDIPDTFLAISKCINYTGYQHTSEFSFGILLCIWTYFRHWQNLRILHSVYYEFNKLVPINSRRWSPQEGLFLPGWMQWQIFGPIMLLHLLNLFWYYLMWRIVYRMIWAGNATDVREEGETDDEDPTAPSDKID